MKTTIAVYGTLKESHHNNGRLKDATPVGQAVTVEKFGLINGGFPVVTPLQYGADTKLWGIGRVAVELYEVDLHTLDKCDQLEGYDVNDTCDSMYVRMPVKVYRHECEPEWVQMYVSFEDWNRMQSDRNMWVEVDYGVYSWVSCYE